LTGAQGDKGATGAQGDKGATGAQGDKGATGAQGDKGATGAQGAKGESVGVPYKFNTSTAAATPGVGYISFNNTTVSAITKIYISTQDINLVVRTVWIQQWDDSTQSGNRGYIYINNKTTGTDIEFYVNGANVSQTGYFEISVDDLRGTLPSLDDILHITFTRNGDIGAQGAAGSSGITGAQGDKGATGAQGDKGATGAQGDKGATGAQGDKGATGAQGDKGATGAQGDKGATGSQGDKGAAGTSGVSGAQGDKGATGAQGAKGAQGDKGATGAQGDKGATGAQGDKGATGAQGDKGATGAQGAAGGGGTSDRRLKKNIRPLNKGLNELLKLNPVSFEYNSVGNDKKSEDVVSYGIIAQDILNEFPELVTTFEQKAHPNDKGPQKYYWVNSEKLQWVTINAFKELNDRVIVLEKQVKELMEKIK